MAKKEKADATPLNQYVVGTSELVTGFVARSAAFAPPEAEEVIGLLAGTIEQAMSFLGDMVENALAAAGVAVEEVQETLDGFGAGRLLEGLAGRLKDAKTAADLAVIGTILPIVKKIIRFVATEEASRRYEIDRILEFIDELATTAFDFVSPKGAEAMHRAELRFLEGQYHLDRLAPLREKPTDGNGR